MFKIEKRGMCTDIYLTRGDTFDCVVHIYDADGQEYTPAGADTVTFAMKLNYSDSTPVLTKAVDTSQMLLTIESGDTADLAMGLWYVYDIQLRTEAGEVYTFISGNFFLMEEVAE